MRNVAVISLQQIDGPTGLEYRVMRLRNTVEFQIGEFIKREKVHALCASDKYDVKIAPEK